MKLFIYLILLFTINCSKGSIGNSLTENSFVLQRLISIINTNLSNVIPTFYLYDDQGDSNLNTFQVISNSTTYNLTINSSSDLLIENYSLYLSKAGDIFARNSSKHLGDNVVAESTANTTSVTERFYSNTTQNSIIFGGLQSSEDELGFHYKKTLTNLSMPRGNITKLIFSVKPVINLSIENGGTTRTFTISYSSTPLSSNFDCPISHSGTSATVLNLRIKYSDIFKDTTSNTPIDTLFQGNSLSTAVLIGLNTSLINSDSLKQYNCIKK
jgi:hypothetical protein